MASLCYNTAAKEILDNTINLSSDTIKVMLVEVGYTANKDDDVVDAGGANDPVDHEISVTGYTAGWGGAGRKTLANKSFTVDDTDDEAVFDNTVDLTWTSLGAGATIVAAIVIKEGGADDTTSRLIAYLELASSFPTNGGDFTLQFDAEGIINLNT
jgi:hypothetical protein